MEAVTCLEEDRIGEDVPERVALVFRVGREACF
jgi:hypothetical protein